MSVYLAVRVLFMVHLGKYQATKARRRIVMKPFIRMISIAGLISLGVIPVAAQNDRKPEQKETLHAKPVRGLPSYRAAGPLSGEIRSIGADTMETLMKLWIEGFTKLYPNVHFTMEAEASGTACPALVAGKADIGPVARETLP